MKAMTLEEFKAKLPNEDFSDAGMAMIAEALAQRELLLRCFRDTLVADDLISQQEMARLIAHCEA